MRWCPVFCEGNHRLSGLCLFSFPGRRTIAIHSKFQGINRDVFSINARHMRTTHVTILRMIEISMTCFEGGVIDDIRDPVEP